MFAANQKLIPTNWSTKSNTTPVTTVPPRAVINMTHNHNIAKSDPNSPNSSTRIKDNCAIADYPNILFSIRTNPFSVPTYRNRSSLVIAVTF